MAKTDTAVDITGRPVALRDLDLYVVPFPPQAGGRRRRLGLQRPPQHGADQQDHHLG